MNKKSFLGQFNMKHLFWTKVLFVSPLTNPGIKAWVIDNQYLPDFSPKWCTFVVTSKIESKTKNKYMKMRRFASIQLKVLIFVLFSSLLPSCRTSTWIVPSEYIGNWESEMNKITVRYKLNPHDDHSRFISDSAIIKLEINEDKTVRGFIGHSVIDSGKILKSWSFPGLRTAEYSIECHTTGKIFEKDPLEAKRVDIWLSLLNEHGKIKGDIRSGGSTFPMGLMIFEKVNK